MFRVGRDEKVLVDVDPRAGPFLNGDDRQAAQKLVENLFRFRGGLGRNAVANLGSRVEDAA